MMRKERRLKAKQKRLNIQTETWNIISTTLTMTKDLNKAILAGDRYLNDLVNQRPQEKALILEAAHELSDKINDTLSKLMEKENA